MNKIFAAVWRYIKQTDMMLILLSIIASLYGLVLIYSATRYMKASVGNHIVLTQIIAIAIGFIAMIVLSKIDYHNIAKYWKIIAAACILLFIITMLFGKGVDGSADKSWLRYKSFSVQPAELIKIAFVITFSKHFSMVKEDISSPKNVLLLGLHAAIPIGFILVSKDMGMALVFVAIFIGMIFVTDIKMRYFAGGAVALLIVSPLIWNKVFGGTQRNRILALFDPTNKLYKDEMLQQNQGVAALASGETWGYGLFKGPKTQSLSSWSLSARHTDMIFAVAGEELGLVGCIAILLIITVILIRLIIDAGHAKDEMGSMICIGAFCIFSIQSIVNLGMVLRVLPVVGLTLPFFSYGGTSVLSAFLTIGIALSVHMHRQDLMFAGQMDS